MIRVHADGDQVRIDLQNLDVPNEWLAGTASFIDKIPATHLKDESTSWKIGTALGYWVTEIKSNPIAIRILNHANDSCAF